jgi:predicted CXXCH cytochrome family protein
MTYSKLVLVVGGLMLGAALAFSFSANRAQASIQGSMHDFSGTPMIIGGGAGDQICAYCHTPHNAPTKASGNNLIPLWNHQTTSQTFEVYSSPYGSVNFIPGQPQGVSKACLSCHDGTVAIDSAGGSHGSNFINEFFGGAFLIPNDLSVTHPFSFAYNSNLTALDSLVVLPTKGANGNYTVGTGQLPLFNGMVECGTCHDPHNDTLTVSNNFLRMANTGSQLCFNCHLK